MNLRYQTTCDNIPWETVPQILKAGEMGYTTPEIHRKSFEQSYSVIFVFDDNKLIGTGRIISDGIRQSAIYDIAIYPEYQGLKIGKEIVTRLMSTTPNCSFILYSNIGKEAFYEKLGFRKMKTGMAAFENEEAMIIKGFV